MPNLRRALQETARLEHLDRLLQKPVLVQEVARRLDTPLTSYDLRLLAEAPDFAFGAGRVATRRQ